MKRRSKSNHHHLPKRRRRHQISSSSVVAAAANVIPGLFDTNDKNVSSSSTNPMMTVLLTAIKPHLQCCLYTTNYGTFCISATTTNGGMKPCVCTLSKLEPKFGVGGDEWYEVPIFGQKMKMKTKPSTNKVTMSRREEDVVVGGGGGDGESSNTSTKGGSPLQEHLERLVNHQSVPSIPDFLRQSERIFHELITVMKKKKKEPTEQASSSSRNHTKENDIAAATCNDEESSSSSSWTVDYAEELMKQLQTLEDHYVGRNVITELSSTLSNLTLQYVDDGQRRHFVSLQLCAETFPHSRPTIKECQLPIKWQPPWSSSSISTFPNDGTTTSTTNKRFKNIDDKSSNGESSHCRSNRRMGGLLGLYADFVRLVCKYQDLWNELDDLDANAWVLEPRGRRPPCRSTSERRIAITETTSIVIGLDLDCPRGPPTSVRWIGEDTFVHRGKLDRYMTSTAANTGYGWSQHVSVLQNLQRALGIHLPSSQPSSLLSESLEHSSFECSICYSHDLPSSTSKKEEENVGYSTTTAVEFPDTVCDNVPCQRRYHNTCLRDWLQSLPSSRISFDRIIGTCPYCSEPISAILQQP